MHLPQPENAETGPETLNGVLAFAHDHLGQGRGVWADPGSGGNQPLRRPLGIGPVIGRHMLRDGGVLSVAGCAHMGGDMAVLVEFEGDRGTNGAA